MFDTAATIWSDHFRLHKLWVAEKELWIATSLSENAKTLMLRCSSGLVTASTSLDQNKNKDKVQMSKVYEFYLYGISWRQFKCVYGLNNDLPYRADEQLGICLPEKVRNEFTDSGTMEDFVGLSGNSKSSTSNRECTPYSANPPTALPCVPWSPATLPCQNAHSNDHYAILDKRKEWRFLQRVDWPRQLSLHPLRFIHSSNITEIGWTIETKINRETGCYRSLGILRWSRQFTWQHNIGKEKQNERDIAKQAINRAG